MVERVCFNADKSAEVPCDSPEAAFLFSPEDAERIRAGFAEQPEVMAEVDARNADAEAAVEQPDAQPKAEPKRVSRAKK